MNFKKANENMVQKATSQSLLPGGNKTLIRFQRPGSVSRGERRGGGLASPWHDHLSPMKIGSTQLLLPM